MKLAFFVIVVVFVSCLIGFVCGTCEDDFGEKLTTHIRNVDETHGKIIGIGNNILENQSYILLKIEDNERKLDRILEILTHRNEL